MWSCCCFGPDSAVTCDEERADVEIRRKRVNKRLVGGDWDCTRVSFGGIRLAWGVVNVNAVLSSVVESLLVFLLGGGGT